MTEIAISVNLYGHQNNHIALRKALACYINEQSKNVSGSDREELCKLASNVSKEGTWIGEDIIPMTANYLHRPIYVYFAADNGSPLKYTPSQQDSASNWPSTSLGTIARLLRMSC